MTSIKHYLLCSAIIVVCVMGTIFTQRTVWAQDDPCTRDALIISFAAAASSGTIDEWSQSYQSGACPSLIKESALELAHIYAALGAPIEQEPVASGDVRLEGEYPVLHVTNALGLEEEVTVHGLQPILDGLSRTCYSDCFVLETAPGVYTGIWITRLRQATYDPATEQYVAVIDTGEQFTGKLYSVLVNTPDGTVDLTGADQITLYSMPPDQTFFGTPPEGAWWTMHTTSPLEMTYVGVPTFTYTYYSSAGYMIGGEDHTDKAVQFQIDVQGRFVSAEIDDFQTISITGSDILEVSTANGQMVNGEVQFVAHDSAGDHTAHTWGLVLTLDEGLYLSFDSNAVLTLTKN